MDMQQAAVSALMKTGPVIPVIVIESVESAVPLARALVAGGVKVLEVTLRTPAALAAIERMIAEVPEAIVGAGTVTNPEQLAQVEKLGVRFAVSPGLTPALAVAAQSSRVPLLPGVATASEIMRAMDVGFYHLKLFPAEQVGGMGALKAYASVFPRVAFCPTGGVSAESASSYLKLPNVLCVGGSWLAPADKVEAGDWTTIETLARSASTIAP